MSAYLNYLNYKAYISGDANLTQIPPYENLSIMFSVGNGTNQLPVNLSGLPVDDVFNYWQTSLLQVYAARLNSLYQVAMSYIVSDQLVSSQTYTPPPTIIINKNGIPTQVTLTAQNKLYKTINAATLASSVNSGAIPGSGILSSNGVFYQYGGINQLYSCVGPNALTTQPDGNQTINLSNCTSAFTDNNTSIYDGINMSAYVNINLLNNQQNQLKSTNELNTSTLCAPNTSNTPLAPMGFTYANAKSGILMCNIWGGSDLVNSGALSINGYPRAIVPHLYGTNPGIGGSNANPGNGSENNWFNITTSAYDSYIFNNNSNLNFTFIASSGGNSGSYGYGNGNFYRSSANNYPWISDGGFGAANNYTHTAFIQAKLPNGFIMPLYIFTYSTTPNKAISNNYSMASLICPNTFNPSLSISGLVSCTQNWNSSGSITLQTADGNSYLVSISPLASHSQGGYYGGNLNITQQ
jgi:hypothetical protein